jgi:hypothetical protein
MSFSLAIFSLFHDLSPITIRLQLRLFTLSKPTNIVFQSSQDSEKERKCEIDGEREKE